MRTVREVEKQERKFKRRSKIFNWIRSHISYSVGEFLVFMNYDMWSDYLDRRY